MDVEIERTAEALMITTALLRPSRRPLRRARRRRNPSTVRRATPRHGPTQLVMPSQAGTAADAAGSGPTVGPARQGRHDRLRCADRSAMRRPPQRGQNPRPLLEKATSRSCPQATHRKRPKPPARHPHRRKSRNSCSTNLGSPSPSRSVVACAGRSRNGHARSRKRWSMWDRAVRLRSRAAPRAAHRRPTCQRTGPVNPAWMPRSRQRGRDSDSRGFSVFRLIQAPATSPPSFRRECSIHAEDAPSNCRSRSRTAAVARAARASCVLDRRGSTASRAL
jgi:hypothetical protein